MVTIDGKDLIRRVRQLLNEPSTSPFLDERTTYDFLYAAARQWIIETESVTAEQSITTVASQAGYTIDGDFLSLYLKDNDEFFIKYNDGTDDYFIKFKPYSEVIFENNTTDADIPSNFTITDDQTLDTLISDAADNDGGSAVGGKAILTMDTAVFTDVTPGDIIHNTTDKSDGIVVKTEATFKILEVCLFADSSTPDCEIDKDDDFIIQPRKRLKLILDPPPETKDHTVTLYYLQSPRPVYSDYDVYPIPFEYADAIAKYAAWLYKYRDDEPDFGDAYYIHWRRQVTTYRRLTNRALVKEESRIIPVMR
ncbi:MAG: hypothetical protein KAX30_04285 [Candidatus Atribacteria bacterium]|nr:hypothetical protein [Candidatus Atribacteria bacterium]